MKKLLKKFISSYENPNIERFNLGLINRDQDKDLILHLIDVFRSLNVLEYVEFLDYEYIEDANKIDMSVYNEYNNRDRKSNKDKEEERYMSLHDSRVGELRARFRFTCKGDSEIVEKRFLLPIVDEYGYYTINGKKFFLIYQMVDSSTYTRGQTVVLKSLLPVNLNREDVTITDSDGIQHSVKKFTVLIFHSKIDILYFYFTKFGATRTLKFFSLDQIMDFTSDKSNTEENLYFPIRSNLFLEVNKKFFNDFDYVRNMAATIMATMTNRTTMEDLDNPIYWMERLGSLRTGAKPHIYYEKGKNTQTSFERMIDVGTQEILKLSVVNKSDTYSVMRWMIQNYNSLRKKDDMDLKNKRLRCNEYIAGFLTAEFSKRVNRIIKYKNRIDLKRVKGIVSMPGDIIITKLHTSGLFRSNESVNDMDFYTKLKYTTKGPNAMGNKSSNSIAVKYRGTHPSYIGNIDVNVCGSSDPGSSGVLTPFAKVDGLHFNVEQEVQDGIFPLEKELAVMQRQIDENKEILFDLLGGQVDISHEEYLRKQEKLYEVSNMITFSK